MGDFEFSLVFLPLSGKYDQGVKKNLKFHDRKVIFTNQIKIADMEKDNKSTKRKKSLTQENESNDGSNIYSYIAAFIVVIGSLLVAFQVLSWGKSLLLVIAGVIFVVLLGAFQLQNDRRIEEENFMQLMILILKKIPPFNIFFR